MSSNDYLYKEIVKSGSIIPISEALATTGLTDEKGNTITFTDPLPTYYVESNGYAYSLEGLDKALVTLRIEKIQGEQLFIQEEKQEKQPNALQTTTRITSKSKQAKK